MNVIYTVTGAGPGVTMWDGYAPDMARELVKVCPSWYWQPVGYDNKPVPMKPGILSGTDEHIRLLQEVHTTGKWVAVYYSEGAIIGSNVLDRLRDPRNPVSHRLADCLGVVALGNPRRQERHGFPGGIVTSGFGIVTPNLKDTPSYWWDLANGDEIPGAGGEDLYATSSDASGVALKQMRAIWAIVYDGNPTALAKEIGKAICMPWRWGAAAVAVIKAGRFFASGTHAHVDYHLSYPIPNDPRDSWRVGVDYLADVMRRNP